MLYKIELLPIPFSPERRIASPELMQKEILSVKTLSFSLIDSSLTLKTLPILLPPESLFAIRDAKIIVIVSINGKEIIINILVTDALIIRKTEKDRIRTNRIGIIHRPIVCI